jgi:glutamate/tyrosine decarboxylase-like PLP-dependent enzyme
MKISPEEMRAIGYRVVDMIVDHMSGIGETPVVSTASRAEMESRLRAPLPEEGTTSAELLDQVAGDVLGMIAQVDHPRFLAYVPSPGNFIGAMADALVAGFNPFAGAWKVAAGPAQIELVTIDWLRQICGMPEGAGGAFVSGGSMANLTAIAVARHQQLHGVTASPRIYLSDQAHSSIERGVGVLGFDRSALRTLPSGSDGSLEIDALAAAVAADRAAGYHPFLVVANAGTTGTGAVDPLVAIARFCRRENLWLHVDGAYGAAAAITDRGKALLDGLGEADSITLDPHKWLFQPIECGCLLVRDGRMLRNTFRVVPDYLRDTDGVEEEVNFRDHGVQLTRSFRALKLWMSLRYFGLRAFRTAIDHGLGLAEHAQRYLADRDCWEIVTPAQLAIITFRYLPPADATIDSDDLNRMITEKLFEDGTALVSTTVVRGMTVLRFCTINPRTEYRDIERTIEILEKLAEDILRL